nr:hypothetical protein [Tanacetum cinerariifolium]
MRLSIRSWMTDWVLDLEKTKTTQALEITSLKRRVKKLEKKQSSRTHKLKRLYKVGLTARVDSFEDDQSLGEDASKLGRKIYDIDANEDITLVNDQDDVEMFDVSDLQREEVFVEKELADKELNDEVQKVVEEVVEDINTAKLIINATQVSVVGEVNAVSIATTISAATTITTDETTLAQALVEIKTSKPKAKGIVLQDPKRAKLKRKDQIRIDEEAALKLQAELQAEFKEEQRLTRESAQKEQEANIALIEECDDIQAKIDKRRKFFAAKAAEEKRNKPLTQAQQRKIMCTYLKNVEGKKLKDLKNKSFDSIQKMFDRAFKRINIFVGFRIDLVKNSSNRAREELTQGSSKKQKVDDDKEIAELKELMEIIPDKEEVEIDVIPWLLKFDKEDLEDLYNLVKANYRSTRPVEDLDLLLWGDLKTMFEPYVEDQVWKKQHRYRVLEWKLYDSCGVHSLRMQSVYIYMLVEKKYPLTAPTLTNMLNKKL